MWASFAVVLVSCSISIAEDFPEVRVKQGRLRGNLATTREGRKFNSFMGIPFAKPPLGKLRFEPPVPAEPWEGTLDATKIHSICPQRDIYRRASLIEGEEDCLYLNVYTPKLPKEGGDPLPVMIFLHGGGFLCGGGNSLWYGPDILLDRDVVLVVTNYRLGALGFLSTGDEVSPGNNGLKDQNLAIRWVKENIAQFAGNPEKITLFGESAGGVSVHLHMLSPLSKGLFHAGIAESGVSLNSWAVAPNDQSIRNGKKLAQAFNCPVVNSRKMVECLKEVDPYKIVEQDTLFMEWDTDPMIPFKPVIEPKHAKGAFLTEHPIDGIRLGHSANISLIVGLNSDDGALRAAGLVANPHLLAELDEDFDTIAPISLEYDDTSSNRDHITKKIRKFYFGDRKLDESVKSDVVNMYTDGWFLHGIDEAIRYHMKYIKKPIYYYLFAHRGDSSFTEIFGDPVNDYGVCHADELQYLFPISDGLFKRKPTEADKRIAKILTSMWVNFAGTGNPTPSSDDTLSEPWLPVQSEDEMEYLYIHPEELGMRKGLFSERTKFWRTLPLGLLQSHIRDEL